MFSGPGPFITHKYKLAWVPGTWNTLRASKILFYKSTRSQFSNDVSELSLRLWVGTHGQNRKNSVNLLKKSVFLEFFIGAPKYFGKTCRANDKQ